MDVFEDAKPLLDEVLRNYSLWKVFLSSDNSPNDNLLQAMGGVLRLMDCVTSYYERILRDPDLFPFFEHVDMDILRRHVMRFLKHVFDDVPLQLGFIVGIHSKLRPRPSMKHYGLMVGHFRAAMSSFNIADSVIDRAVLRLQPLQEAFEWDT